MLLTERPVIAAAFQRGPSGDNVKSGSRKEGLKPPKGR